MSAPPGPVPVPNPDDPGRGPLVSGITWTLTTLCTIIVLFRLYINASTQHKWKSEDWFMLSALIFQLAFQSIVQKAVEEGLGKHQRDLNLEQTLESTKWTWISVAPAFIVGILARISITILLIRIFGSTRGGSRWLRWFLIVFTSLQTISAMLSIIFVWAQVNPPQGLWDPTIPARRWNPNISTYSTYLTQAFFASSDLIYSALPIGIIWHLHMHLRQRIGLSIVLALSLVTMAATIVKTVITQVASNKARSGDMSYDIPYETCLASIWGAVDQTLLISLGCVPLLYKTVGPLLQASFSRLHSIFSASVYRFSSGHYGKPTGSSKSTGAGSGPFGERSGRERGGYVDIELDPRVKGIGNGSRRSNETELPLQMPSPGGARQESFNRSGGSNTIWRTDQIQVTYDERGRAMRGI